MAPRDDALPAPADALPAPADAQRVSPRAPPFRRLVRRRGAAVGLVAIAFFVGLALLAPH